MSHGSDMQRLCDECAQVRVHVTKQEACPRYRPAAADTAPRRMGHEGPSMHAPVTSFWPPHGGDVSSGASAGCLQKEPCFVAVAIPGWHHHRRPARHTRLANILLLQLLASMLLWCVQAAMARAAYVMRWAALPHMHQLCDIPDARDWGDDGVLQTEPSRLYVSTTPNATPGAAVACQLSRHEGSSSRAPWET